MSLSLILQTNFICGPYNQPHKITHYNSTRFTLFCGLFYYLRSTCKNYKKHCRPPFCLVHQTTMLPSSSKDPVNHSLTTTSVVLPTATKRGFGECSNCKSKYPCRRKPKDCETCGFELGGKFGPNTKKKKIPLPASVELVSNDDGGSLRSVLISQNDDRNFCWMT